MLIDPDTPVYELIDNRAYSHSHSMAHQTSHIGLASPHIPVPAGDQLGEEGSTHSLFRKRQFFFQDWIAELIALLFAAVSLTTISVLLIAYHGRPVNSLPQGITLNAVVALLTAAYKAALLFTVSSAIGQSKWNMFSTQPRRLRGFEHIDEASKAPSQVTIKSDAVWTKIFTNFTITPPAEYDGDPTLYFTSYVNGAAWNEPSFYDRHAHCPTGNCTFPPFMSLQWCAKTKTIDVNRVNSNCTDCIPLSEILTT
ncbi:hypothetical protein CIB48_g4711 [Xylaria polymorpha]|nr:hypothetical protein CIB48_g4711 [Xylaria polymorpha]